MWKIRVQYGVDVEEMESDRPITVRAIKGNESLRDKLRYGDRVNVIQNGVTLSDDTIVQSGTLVKIETAANTKAVTK